MLIFCSNVGPLTLCLEDMNAVECSINIGALLVSVYISLCLTNEKSKFPHTVWIFLFILLFFCCYNCDPDQWEKKGSFPSFVDKLPKWISCFPPHRYRYEFPKDWSRQATDPTFMQVNSRVNQSRLATWAAAEYVEESKMQFIEGAGIVAMQNVWL